LVKVLSETVDGDEDLLESVTANINEDVLRAYLAECRELTPVFANDAVKEALRTWYVETKTQLIRREREEDRVIPLTPRTQQDVIRLAVASAKARHSEEIEMVDAERATRLKSRSFRELGLSEEIGVDVTADADGVETDAPTAVVEDVVESLNFEGEAYGANSDAVASEVAARINEVGVAGAADLVEDMVAADTLRENGDGRLVV